MSIPTKIWNLLEALSPSFTRPTFARFMLLTLASIITAGSRTVDNLVRTLRGLLPGHRSSYHRVFSKRCWAGLGVGRCLATLIIARLAGDGIVHLAGDDTVDEHRGVKVYGKDCHRDPIRSSKTHTTFKWGHKWVVLSILVRLPFAKRPWALPVLMALYRSPKSDEKLGKRHKTPAEIMQSLLAVMIRWFPERRFRVSLDGGFATHELADFACRHQHHLTLVSRFYAKANLYESPPPRRPGTQGRPRKKGAKLPSPAEVVAKSRPLRMTVRWYGGELRRVEIVSAVAHWYRMGKGLVPVRWVFVKDLTGTHRDEYFFTTDLSLIPKIIIETYTERWSIEVTFEESRAYLGFGTTRCRTKNSVLREAPSLLALYSLVTLLYVEVVAPKEPKPLIMWSGKTSVTFSDAVTATRRWLWENWVFENAGTHEAFSKLTPTMRHIILDGLASTA
jgi:hypothetical protein